MQQNNKCRLWEERDETVNHIRKCSKLIQKAYKTKPDWVVKVIHWELCKRLTSDHNYQMVYLSLRIRHNIIWDFEIQMAHLIPARRLELVLINKKERTWHLADFAIPTDYMKKVKR